MTVSAHDMLLNLEPGRYLGRPRMEWLLDRLSPPADEDASSLYLRPDGADFLASARRDDALGDSARQWTDAMAETGGSALDSDTGVVGLQSARCRLLVVPPFPVLENRLVPRWDTGPLLELLATRYTVGVALLRLGRFSVAVYRGEDLQSSKTDARYVKGRHRAGGSSQMRFARIREGQMRRIYDKTCEAARAQLGPVLSDLDFVVLGGERLTLNGFLNVCPFMKQFEGKILSRRLNIRDPKRDTLAAVGKMLTESRVYPTVLPQPVERNGNTQQ
jgi:hypothetical protein